MIDQRRVKPCPCCGSKAVVVREPIPASLWEVMVQCAGCGLQIVTHHQTSARATSMAKRRWNRRVES